MKRSAAVRWGEHYLACEVCQIDERAPERDRVCSFGEPLRRAAVEEFRMAERKVAG